MIVPFDTLAPEARVWVYPSNRKLSDEEVAKISIDLNTFLESWTAHGQNLQAAFKIPYNRFIIIGLDENTQASGCSIDSQVRMIQTLESTYDISLLDRMNVTFRQGDFLAHKPLLDFKNLVKSRSVGPQTIVFNNLVQNVAELNTAWEVSAQDSWHARFF